MSFNKQPQQSPFEPLSRRERDIVTLLAQNLSDREIAARLYISYTTVKWYNRQIFNKLGVENRQQAAARALGLGLVETPSTAHRLKQDLPIYLTPFIGRLHEIGDLTQLFSNASIRLITLLAPGGMGKTRLALQIAEAVDTNFADGVFFVPLATLTSTDHLLNALADSIGLQFAPNARSLKQQLYDFFRQKHALLILDNFEQLLESATFIPELLHYAASVKVLVTSREKLNVRGETLYQISGMPYPETLGQANIRDYGSVQLFLQSAFRASPHFIAEDETALVQICQLVQGMPLAIELAAGWVTTLSLADIATEIHRSIDFLQTTLRDVPERLRSIRAVFDATWLKLTEEEQQTFRRLSIFQGGFTREAAEVVASTNLQTMSSLTAKALLWYTAENSRYEIHELLRQYAQEQLGLSEETDLIEKQHRSYFGQFSYQWGKALKTKKQLLALDMLDADYENIRSAFERAIETRQAELIEPFTELWYFYEIRGRFPEGNTLFSAAIEALTPEESLVVGKLLAGQGLFFERYGWFDTWYETAKKGVDILRRTGGFRELPMAMMVLGDALMIVESLERALEIYHEAFALAQENQDSWAESNLRFLFGTVARDKQQFDAARKHFSEAFILMQAVDNFSGMCFCLNAMAFLALQTGNEEEAKQLYEAALLTGRKVRQLPLIAAALTGLQKIAFRQGDLIAAKYLGEDALEIDRRVGWIQDIFTVTITLAQIAVGLGNLEEAQQFIVDSVALAREMDDGEILPLLLVAAELCLRAHKNEQAIELAGFIEENLQQNTLNPMDMKRLKTVRDQGKNVVSDAQFNALYVRGTTRSRESILVTLSLNL